MRIPQRVPWASKQELAQLYELIFAPDADEPSKKRGLARMSIYLASPSCPTFIHLLHSLVSAELLPPPTNVGEAQVVRLSCAMAVVRFVNGMVDPLQTGPYARPISHLAASLNIPPTLISLRHRATHEDLPPLPLLRTSILQCIAYLHTYSFLPLLAESSALPAPSASADRTGRLVARYKRMTKDRLREREVDESTPRAKELRRVRRAMQVEDVEDLVEALCSTEGIVPLARRKRPSRAEVALPASTLQLWEPLLVHLAPSHPTLASALADQISALVLEHEPSADLPLRSVEERKDAARERSSFRWTMAVWLLWLWTDNSAGLVLDREVKQEVWSKLAPALLEGDVVLRRLARRLAQIDSSLVDSWTAFEAVLPSVPVGKEDEDQLSGLEDVVMVDDDALHAGLAEMEARLQRLQGDCTAEVVDSASTENRGNGNGASRQEDAPGWRKLSSREWRPCPIGTAIAA